MAGTLPLDSVMTSVPEPVVITVADSLGHPRGGVRIEIYSGLRVPPIGASPPAITFATSQAGDRNLESTIARTDSAGQVHVWLQYGRTAAEALLYVRGKDASVFGADSLSVNIQPGAAAGVLLEPADTTVYVGEEYTVRAQPVDRFGNNAREVAGFDVRRPNVLAVGQDGTVKPGATGRAYVIASAGEALDSVAVSVVPGGHVLAYKYGPTSDARPRFYSFELNGTNYREVGDELRGFNHRSQYYLPGTDRVVFHGVPPGGSSMSMTLYSMDAEGSVATVFAPEGSVQEAWFPQPTHDGQWVYFVARKGYEHTEMWRVRPDGADAAAVGLEFDLAPILEMVSPSPDGSRLAVAMGSLRIYRPDTGELTEIAQEGHRPRWSPVADEIAYFTGHVLSVITPDGSTVLGPIDLDVMEYDGFDSGNGQIDWSPDGEWMIVCGTTPISGRRYNLLVRRSDGEVLPLEHTKSRNLCGATWAL